MSMVTVTQSKPNTVVSHYDVYRELRTALHMFQKFPRDLDDSERQKLTQEVVKQSAIEEAVLRSKESSEVYVPKDVERASVEEIIAQFSEPQILESNLQQYGIDLAMFEDAVARDLKVSAVLDYIADQSELVSDLDAELFYQLHTDRFSLPERRKVRHILITINDEFKDNVRENSQARAKEVLHKLKHSSLKIEKLAKQYSECPTAIEGGLLGTLAKGQLYPELDDVLFGMAVGEISDMIESPLGFHILQCDEVIPSQLASFAEVGEKIKRSLYERNRRAYQKQWLTKRMSEISH